MSEKANILIVGDESVCRTIGDILKAEGYKVKTAQTGSEAVEQVRRTPFNLAIVDTKLSDASGIELLKTIREISPTIRAVVSTTYATVVNLAEAVEKNISRISETTRRKRGKSCCQ